jgi:hypothetical protein
MGFYPLEEISISGYALLKYLRPIPEKKEIFITKRVIGFKREAITRNGSAFR